GGGMEINMHLTNLQTLIIIIVIALGTMITRFTPFILFPDGKEYPKIIDYLGEMLPPAMMGLLVVYCFKNVSFLSDNHGLPEITASVITVLLHLWKKNVLLSICGGTAAYMLLVQFVFHTV
ncbi:MAG: branched-chain amino acid transporter permease, partial [Clostridia bacterium]|nr:branched-chain amino acid transporter permease [Clostridia bacterium]